MKSITQYNQKKKVLLREFKTAISSGRPIALKKNTSNLFRARNQGKVARLDVTDFTHVISVDAKKRIAEVEGMATYETIVAETLKHGLMPAVVPQLKTITLGGAVTGVGIESSSFKYGFPHETLLSMEILTGDGRVVEAKPTGPNKQLFFGFPNSYGSLGYALKLTIKLVPVKKYVKLTHIKYSSAKKYFAELQKVSDSGKWQGKPVDFVDGMIYRRCEYYMVLGQMTDTAPYVSDYTYKNIYYKSIRERAIPSHTDSSPVIPDTDLESKSTKVRSQIKFGMTKGNDKSTASDYLTIADYIWRWDTDWFWCSSNMYAQNPIVRRLFGSKRLRSDVFMKFFNFEIRHGYKQRVDELLGKPAVEMVIQDVEIPIENCEKFVKYYHKTINIMPAWVCPVRQAQGLQPVRQYDPKTSWSLYKTQPQKLYVNFGFWSSVPSKKQDPAWHNKSLEAKVTELKGKKSLYSSSYYDEKTFWKLYNKPDYSILKKQYDPDANFKDLYDKTVRRG